MFSFEIEESSLTDTRCCITTLVIKEWCDVAPDLFCRTTLSWYDVTLFVAVHSPKSSYCSGSLSVSLYNVRQYVFWRHFDSIVAGNILNYVLGNENMTVNWWYILWMNEITWHHIQNVVLLRVLYKFVHFNSTLVICLKFVFYWNVW
jgi:hypothetical protein